MCSLLIVDWSKVKNVCVSNNENSSLFIVETHFRNQFVVVKNCKYDTANQALGTALAAYLGLAAPHFSILDDAFLPSIKSECVKGLLEWAVRSQDVEIQVKIERELQHAKALLLLEYVPCLQFDELVAESCCFDSMTRFKIVQHFRSSTDFWTDLGKMFVLDLFTNNCDRFPCKKVWDHNGNPTNILIFHSRLVALDQSCTPIVDTDHKQRYFRTLSEFVEGSRNNDSTRVMKFLDDIFLFLERFVGDIFTPGCLEKKMVIDSVKETLVSLRSLTLQGRNFEILQNSILSVSAVHLEHQISWLMASANFDFISETIKCEGTKEADRDDKTQKNVQRW